MSKSFAKLAPKVLPKTSNQVKKRLSTIISETTNEIKNMSNKDGRNKVDFMGRKLGNEVNKLFNFAIKEGTGEAKDKILKIIKKFNLVKKVSKKQEAIGSENDPLIIKLMRSVALFICVSHINSIIFTYMQKYIVKELEKSRGEEEYEKIENLSNKLTAIFVAIVGPLIEEASKMLAVSQGFGYIYTTVFNFFEMTSYVSHITHSIPGVKIGKIIIARGITAAMHYVTTFIIKLGKKFSIPKPLIFFLAFLIHGIYNFFAMKYNEKVVGMLK